MKADGINVFDAGGGRFRSYVNVGRLVGLVAFRDILMRLGVEWQEDKHLTHVTFWITATPEEWDPILRVVAAAQPVTSRNF